MIRPNVIGSGIAAACGVLMFVQGYQLDNPRASRLGLVIVFVCVGLMRWWGRRPA